jgi:cytoskeletal protein CcmA (bactofilin family)
MNNPNPWMLVLVFLLCSGLFLMSRYPRWQRRHSLAQSAGVLPRDADDLPARVEALHGEMNRLIANAVGQRDGSGFYESLDEALQRGHQAPASAQARPILVTQAAQTQQGITSREPLYAVDDLQLREGSDLTLVLSRGHLVLGAHSRVRVWAHADKTLLLGEDSVASQQLSSGRGIALAEGCRFQRLQAPVIVMGRPLTRRRGDSAQPCVPLPEQPPLQGATPLGAEGWRIDGDCTIEAGHHFRGALVVSGTLRIGAQACVEGNVKARRGVVVGERATVSGAVLSEQDIHIHEEAEVGGPVVAARLLSLGANVRLGSLLAPTSVHAPEIRAGEGVIAHGTVFATEAGYVGAA